MARLFTAPFEFGSAAAQQTVDGYDVTVTGGGTATTDATIFRSGARSEKFTFVAAELYFRFSFTATLANVYYHRFAIYLTNLPDQTSWIGGIFDGNGLGVEGTLSTGGVLGLGKWSTNVSSGITGPTLATGQMVCNRVQLQGQHRRLRAEV